MNNIEKVTEMVTNSEIIRTAIVNNNSLEIFNKFKGDKASEKELNFYKRIKILDIEEQFENEDDEEFIGYEIQIKFDGISDEFYSEENGELINIYIDQFDNINIF